MSQSQPENNDVFTYTNKDFNFSTNSWAAGSALFELSMFDVELRRRWDAAMKGGAFRYDIDHITTRIIPGSKRYVAQLNLLRAKERRKPQDIRSISQPFDPSQFNFSWISPQEVVFSIKNITAETSSDINTKTAIDVEKSVKLEKDIENEKTACAETAVGLSNVCNQSPIYSSHLNGLTATDQDRTKREEHHTLIINVSPMEYGHCLLIPQTDSCLPQVVTETSITVVLEMMLLSKHRGFVVGFNSLCAFASVNHLHFHAYYLQHELIVDHCPVQHLVGRVYENTTIAVPGFAIQLFGSSVAEVSRDVHHLSHYFQKSDIAHNLFMCRGVVFGEGRHSDRTTVRVFIWPRRKFVGTKSSEEFNVASIELGGHLPIRELEGYHTLTEEAVDTIIADSRLPDADYEQIKEHVVNMFAQNFKNSGTDASL